MRFHCAISDNESSHDAVEETIRESEDATGGKIDAVFAFLTGHHRENAEDILERLWLELDPQALIGCSAEGVIAADREIEREPGLAVLVAQLPDVRIHPFHVAGRSQWRQALNEADDLKDRLGLGEETRGIILMGDPFTTPLDQLLAALEVAASGVPVVGGMASSGRQPGKNVVLRNDQAFGEGVVGLSLAGPLRIDTVVSQGCRPIGTPMIVTRSHDNVIEQLGGRPALAALQRTIDQLSGDEQELLSEGLLIGLAISEYRERFGRGDFLVRNLIGADQESGAISVAGYVRTGQTVQFQVRDAASADEDLRLMLAPQQSDSPPAGGLLFSCNGRGVRLFEQPCHDIHAVHQAFSQVPVAGFFAAGEIGPVAGRSFVHGHTASIALFRPQE